MVSVAVILDFQPEQLKVIFIYTIPSTKFPVKWTQFKTDFQDGGHMTANIVSESTGISIQEKKFKIDFQMMAILDFGSEQF